MAVVTGAMRKWLAIGTGVGIEIGAHDLSVAVVRVRPSGKTVVDTKRIEGFAERPATEWGTDLTAFLRKAGAARVPATVLLPRRDVIVRHLALPGVQDRDIEQAISYQLDSLHPYSDEEAASGWARLPGTPFVLVGISRHEVVDRYSNLFAEAGIRLAGFSFSPAAIYSALRLHGVPPAEFLAFHDNGAGLEVYGESAARPVFSGVFDQPAETVTTLARSELRLPAEVEPQPLSNLLGLGDASPFVLPVAAATVSACPMISLDANLLPVDRRVRSNYLAFAPTAGLAALLLVAFVALSAQSSYQNSQYLAKLQNEIAVLEKQAVQVQQLDNTAEAQRQRLATLDRFEVRTRADADALREITQLLEPPAWIESFQLNRETITLRGESDQAPALLKMLDESPIFRDSQFSQTMGRVAGSSRESFFIRTSREGPGTGQEPSK